MCSSKVGAATCLEEEYGKLKGAVPQRVDNIKWQKKEHRWKALINNGGDLGEN